MCRIGFGVRNKLKMCASDKKVGISDSPRIPMVSEHVSEFLSRGDTTVDPSCGCCCCRQKYLVDFVGRGRCTCRTCYNHNRSISHIPGFLQFWNVPEKRIHLRYVLKSKFISVLVRKKSMRVVSLGFHLKVIYVPDAGAD